MTNKQDTREKKSLKTIHLSNLANETLACHNDDQINKLPQTASQQDDDIKEKLAHKRGTDPRNWWRRTRIHVAFLGLTIGAVNCYAQATFCIAIVEMVLPADYVIKSESGQSATVKVSSTTIGHVHSNTMTSIDDQSCPVEYKYRQYYDDWRFLAETTTTTNLTTLLISPVAATSQTIDVSNRFDWDASQQGILLGAVAVGTAPLQVFGGRLAEIYGSKWVLFASCIGTALTNLAIPYLAHLSFILLVIDRVIMGIAQAGMEPGLMCLLAEWLTPAETGFFISMLLFAMCTGFFLGSLCSSFILALNHGWPLTYYISGGLNLFVALLWIVYAESWPRFSKYISINELNFIEYEQKREIISVSVINNDNNNSYSKQQQTTNDKQNDLNDNHQYHYIQNISSASAVINQITSEHMLNKIFDHNQNDENAINGSQKNANNKQGQQKQNLNGQAPWMNILTTRSVWAFIICKISIRWCADVISNELPTYLANVLHLSIKLNGILNSISSALFAIFSFTTGWLVNEILTKQVVNIDKTTLRKIFQSTASFGSALAVFLMTHYDCNILFSMSMLLVLSCCLVMGTGGELQIPYDMTSRYPGTLHGMACTLSVSGWLAPPLIGLILADQPSSRHRWSIVWYLTASINLIGGLVFVLFADASPRDFDLDNRSKRNKSATGNESPEPNFSTKNNNHMTSGGHYNIVCKPLDSSPVQTKRQTSDSTITIGAPQSSSYFDNQPIRVRQSEASFYKPASFYCASADSPLASCTVIFPYKEKQDLTLTGSQSGKLKTRTLKKNGRQSGQARRGFLNDIFCTKARTKQLKTESNITDGVIGGNCVAKTSCRPSARVMASGKANGTLGPSGDELLARREDQNEEEAKCQQNIIRQPLETKTKQLQAAGPASSFNLQAFVQLEPKTITHL